MTAPSEKSTRETFPAELRSFWSLCLLSLVLGALALAFGLRFIVEAVAAVAGAGTFDVLRFVQALAGWAAAVIGFRWVLSSARILSGVGGILRDYQALERSAGEKARERSRTPIVPAEVKGREDSTPGKAGEAGLASEKPDAGVAPGAGSARGAGTAGPGTGSGGGPDSPEALDGPFLATMAHYRENWKTYWKLPLISTLGGWIFVLLGVLGFMDGYPAWEAGGGPHLPFLAGGIAIALGVASILVSRRFREYARTWERRLIDAGQGDEILPGPGEQGSP